jgi:hypothetical protein
MDLLLTAFRLGSSHTFAGICCASPRLFAGRIPVFRIFVGGLRIPKGAEDAFLDVQVVKNACREG